MAQVSYGTITITDTNDIESIVVEYARNQSTSTAPTSGWSTNRPAWAQGYYIWQRTRIHKAGTLDTEDEFGTAVCITGAAGQTGAAGRGLTTTETTYTSVASGTTQSQVEALAESAWTTSVPSYNASKPDYWVRVKNTYDKAPTIVYIYYKDNATGESLYNAAMANSIAQHANEDAQGAMSQAADAQYQTGLLAARVKNYWWDSTGAHIASGIVRSGQTEADEVITTNSATYGYNSLVGLGSLTFGYNSYKALELDGGIPALKFYKPSKTAQGDLTATLDSNGLVLSEGGVKAGTAGQSGFIYLSTKNYGSNLTINNHQASNWREIIGTKFGVDADGNLYASNVEISGKITVGSGSTIDANATINGINASTVTTNVTKALQQSVEYIVGTQTAATNVWTGVTTDSSLVVGKTIAYYLPFAGTSTAATLNLTLAGGGTTGAKNVRWNNSNITTHYPQYSIIQMTYDGTYWRTAAYNSDSVQRTKYEVNLIAAATITNGHIICGNASGYRDIAASVSFDLNYPLLYAGTAIASGATSGTLNNNYLDYQNITFSNNGTITSGAAGKMLYLKGTVNGSIFTISASPFLTTVVPSSDDGLYYIPLGLMSSTTNGYFESTKDVYGYRNDSFHKIDTVVNYITQIDAAGIWITPSSSKPTNTSTGAGATGTRINANGMQIFRSGTSIAEYGDTIRIGKYASGKRNVYVTDSAIQFRNYQTVLAEYGDSITLYQPGTSTAVVSITNSGATFTGGIVANSLTINDNGSSYNAWDAINITGYSLDIEVDATGVSDIYNTTYLYPHLYHNGTEITLPSSATTAQKQEFYNKFLWYEGDSSTAVQGDYLNKGRILASYGDYWRVTYAFDDGATEGATPVQQVTVDPSTYITRIDDNTIKVHSKNWNTSTGFIQIDSQGNIIATNQIQSHDDIIATGQIYRENNVPLTSVQLVKW